MEQIIVITAMMFLLLIITVTAGVMCVYRQGLKDGQDLSHNVKLKDVKPPFPLPKKADGEAEKAQSDFDEGMKNIMAHFNRKRKAGDDEE